MKHLFHDRSWKTVQPKSGPFYFSYTNSEPAKKIKNLMFGGQGHWPNDQKPPPESSKTVSKTTFWSFQKSWWKYLIKPVVSWYFWSPFCKMAPKSIKKALGFSVKVECVLRLCETSKTVVKQRFATTKKVDQNTL